MTVFLPREMEPGNDVVDFLALDESADLTTCDREPIHLPGAIQPHGVLLAVSEADFTVRQASANTMTHIGIEARTLIGEHLSRALGAEPVERLRAALAHPRADGSDPLVVHMPSGGAFEVTWHRVQRIVIVELEPADQAASVAMSTLFEDVRHALEALQSSHGVQQLCESAAREIKLLTGYDRVMVYRFHSDEHGEVVAEEREPGLEPFLGLHYPASDIPRQARKLYLLNHLRVIVDVDYQPVPLLGRAQDADAAPLDLSLAGLRSVSPFHLAYLRNMGVRATLTISLLRGTRLWGMIACHHHQPKRIGAQQRAAGRLLGKMFSLLAVAEESHERDREQMRLTQLQSRLVTHMSGSDSLADALIDGAVCPLDLTAADGLVARIDGRTVTLGAVPPAESVDVLLARLRSRDDDADYFVSDALHGEIPDLAPYPELAAGVLAVPLSAGYQDFVMWFRGELRHTTTWGGNPDKPMVGDPTAAPDQAGLARLGPRESFAAWTQEVRGRCGPWRKAEIATARTFGRAVPELLLASARDRLAHFALHDELTGLPNRALLTNRLEQALARPREQGEQVALLFVDLDHFKLVNDSLGHATGDSLLRQAAQRLGAATRGTDTVARIGGDEFVVLCESISGPLAEQLAERVVLAFRVPFSLAGTEALITASVGVAVADSDTTPAELLRDADTAMYRAKNAGRNAAAAFTPELRAINLRRVEIETRLRPALERGELELHFQPIHTIAGELCGFEALSRWPLAGRGLVPPSEFIPVAEATGLLSTLTDWALDTGLAALARWRALRPDLDLTLSVNIAPTRGTTTYLQQAIASALARHHIPAHALCLEITESALIVDDAPARHFFMALRDLGVRLSIDDFGTGYSSFAYLTQLPVDEVKIDQTFISALADRTASATVVASIVGLAHQLGLQALAEGVETAEQLAAVRRLGCDLVQGYLLGRPMPAQEVDRLIGREAFADAD
ncbi:EAL domain-containing protein [Nakamurella antarctica]|uniref:EAL domain-containing protein n=1 Tax=Nakamurella antarctica TaxID=1902245 RepID=A0A3G8ZHP2_9ACTN|nr:EAL domain-containing protein [Nakamurella antarctica]AZI56892.1 EAL domain-containing protein [Nakamurella antarctica]